MERADVVHIDEVLGDELPIARQLEDVLVRGARVLRPEKAGELSDIVLVEVVGERLAVRR